MRLTGGQWDIRWARRGEERENEADWWPVGRQIGQEKAKERERERMRLIGGQWDIRLDRKGQKREKERE